jgi:hypothetical protein
MSPGENGDTATSKLVNSRQSRKKAEEDVKLLANRIALLKMEEKKVRFYEVIWAGVEKN